MSELREANFGASAGQKGIGKSFQAIRMMEKYVRGVCGQDTKPRKILILDVQDEYSEYEALHYNDIAKFSAHPKVEIRRIRPFYPESGLQITHKELEKLLFYAASNFRGGMLFLEDINTYVGDQLTQDTMGLLCSNRHADLDIFMQFQAIGRITPKVWQNLNYLRFFKNLQGVDYHKEKFPERYSVFKIAELMVEKEYEKGGDNEHFNLHIDLNKNKIIGDFTKEMIVEAIETYISTNFKTLMKDKKSYFDAQQGRVVDRSVNEIFLQLRKEFYLKYNGNLKAV